MRHLIVTTAVLAFTLPAFAQDTAAPAAKAAPEKAPAAQPAKAEAPAAKKPAAAKAETAKAEKKAAKPAKKKAESQLAAFGGWKPTPVKKKDVKGVKRFLDALDKAWMKGPEAVADHHAFPVMTMTTNSKGDVLYRPTDREAFIKEMKMPEAAMALMKKIKRTGTKMEWVTDQIVFVNAQNQLKADKKAHKWQSGMLLIHDGTAWKVHTMIEGGWGDMPADAGAGGGSE